MTNGNLNEMAISLKIEKTFLTKTSWNGETIVVTDQDLSLTLKQIDLAGQPFWTIIGTSQPSGDWDDDEYFYDYLSRMHEFIYAINDWLHHEI